MHLLARLRGLEDEGSMTACSPEDSYMVDIKHDRIYEHKKLRVNYTTYDLRRDSDVVRVNGRADVMLDAVDELNPEHDEQAEPRRYTYARVIGIYHAEVRDFEARGSQYKVMDILHVRWYGSEPEWHYGWRARRLNRIGFVPEADPDAFGFLDPALVVRGCHIVPAFEFGRTRGLLLHSLMARREDETDDWQSFYVNRYV